MMEEFKYNNKSENNLGRIEVQDKERWIEIKIATREKGEGRVSVKLISNIFFAVQNIFDELGDYYAGHGFRPTGPSKKSVKELIELELIGAHHSDLIAVLELPRYQAKLTNEEPLAKEVIKGFDQIIEKISMGSDIDVEIGEIITEPKQKVKILKSFQEFWPKETENHDIFIKSGVNETRHLKNEKRTYLDKYLEGEKKEGELERVGPITSIKVIKPLTLELGKKKSILCRFTKDVEETARQLVGGIVKVRGKPETKKRDAPMALTNVDYVEPIKEWKFEEIHWGGYDLKLKKPLVANVSFVDEMVVIENSELNILAVSDDWEDCLVEFNEYFVFLWEGYALVLDNELTEESVKFKNKLIDMVEDNA